MLQFIISLLLTIVIARPEGQVNQEINEPDDLLAVENLISEVILPPPSTGTVEYKLYKGSSINHMVKFLGIFEPPQLHGHFYKIRLM